MLILFIGALPPRPTCECGATLARGSPWRSRARASRNMDRLATTRDSPPPFRTVLTPAEPYLLL